ncbi:MAG: nuclease-related domain-containing protein [Gammaproteobacteria bacterium]|nr:nuclease-related domain-containing protein [Gammaproteobacteria bacterium]
MKRNPGDWLRTRILERNLLVALYTVAGTGWLGGAFVVAWVAWAGSDSKPLVMWDILIPVLLPVTAFLGLAFFSAKRGWRVRDMRRGARAEEKIGQAIEYALTRDTCAVAHHVEEKDIARVGDIDHLVATPDGLWVIETKHGRVPKPQFRETLRRIAANVEGVRKWAPGVQVTGCLVFASKQDKPPAKTFKLGKDTIMAFDGAEALMRKLREKARGTGGCPELARSVWKLGILEAAD